jgi:hypothetical protein
MDKKLSEQGYGGLGMFFFGAAIAMGLFFFIFPSKFRHFVATEDIDNKYCKPYIEDNGDIKPDAPSFTAPSYEYNSDPDQLVPLIKQDQKKYRLVKANVPILQDVVYNYFSPDDLHNQTPHTLKCPSRQAFAKGQYHHHFCQYVHEAIHIDSPLTKADKYAILYPSTYALSTGINSMYWTIDGQSEELPFAEYQILWLVHLHNDNTMYTVPGTWQDYTDPTKIVPKPFALLDVYQQVQDTNPTKPYKPLPESVLRCGHPPKDIMAEYTNSTTYVEPSQQPSKDHKQLQLQWFVIQRNEGEFNWYFPACKPAINLYPTKDTIVNVKVNIPHGFLTYTDPLYPQNDGWTVLAHPSGNIQYLSQNLASSNGIVNYPTGTFPYLYYEGKVQDNHVTKPDTGFVRSYTELSSFFDELLPQLGLSTKETQEFKTYWLKALPKSLYYFIGIIPQEQINMNEPLTITPNQDTLIRVRLYFEILDHPKLVEQPDIKTPVRSGFTVVDWGGMVKRDKTHPFTCVQ